MENKKASIKQKVTDFKVKPGTQIEQTEKTVGDGAVEKLIKTVVKL